MNQVIVKVVWAILASVAVFGVEISVKDICGNKLVGSCPKKISLKVIGGQSSCAEKVPWNVLIELTSTRQSSQASGNCENKSLHIDAKDSCT